MKPLNIKVATSNMDKFEEIKRILNQYAITAIHFPVDIIEGDYPTIEETIVDKARAARKVAGGPVLIDDTGIFFHAYENFPGAKAKRVYLKLGFGGIMKALEGKDRSATFKTVLCYTEHDDQYELFEGTMAGRIDTQIHEGDRLKLPYERIFIPNGQTKSVSELTDLEKNKISHRAMAARKFAKFFLEKQGVDPNFFPF